MDLHFASSEEYFQVFATTTKDLQQLEEKVVVQVTAFYTYMKTMRDYLRRLSDIRPDDPNYPTERRMTLVNVVYMLFLSYESARRAIRELVEYEPERERLMTIFLTELQAYKFLLERFRDENAIEGPYPKTAGRSAAEIEGCEYLCQELLPLATNERIDLRYRRLVLRGCEYVDQIAELVTGGVASDEKRNLR